MGSGLYFPICALLFSGLLCILVISKKTIRTPETKMYNALVFTNFIGLIVEISCTFASFIYDSHPLISSFILKLYLVYVVTWALIFTIYIFYISHPDTFLQKIKNKGLFWVTVFYLLSILVISILPIISVAENNFTVRYTKGASVDFTYMVSSLLVGVMLYCMMKDIKNLKQKRYLPLFVFLGIGSVAMIYQKYHPSMLLMTYVETFITTIMYHTIENPDLKMLNELELAKNNAERANEAKTEFLSSMSHEIRTPLNAIVGFSNSILEDETLEDAKTEAKDIIMASENLLEIVNGILDISKIEAGKMEIVDMEYRPREVFENITKLIRPRIGEKPIELKTNFSKDIPAILYGDMGKVKEIITNLLTNAVKYTEKGVIDFSVSCINEKENSKLVISVEDTGRGIKPEKIDKLFTKFERLEEDRNTTLEGTGLGLAITKNLVEMMGGKIVVQSKYGSGSKFTVYLKQKIVKMVEEKKRKEIVEENTSKEDYSDKRILIVDDNMLNIKVATRLLKNYGIVPDMVLSGVECLEKVKDTEYDLILMDDMMPGLSGGETLQKLKEDEKFKVPVVVLTANAITGMREKYLSDGFVDYLAKPIDKLELARVLKEYLNDEK